MTGEQFELDLIDMAHGGSALGRHDGRTVFVPYTIPGERALVRVTGAKGRVLFAEGERLLRASADRAFPRCPHFGPGKCGRCHWQHIDYAAQLLLKQDVLADQLERIGGFVDADVRPVFASPQVWNYNARMTFGLTGDGQLGFASARSGDIYPVDECHILRPELLALKESLDLEGIPHLVEVTLQLGSDGAHMLVLKTVDDEAPELLADLPTSVNLVLSDGQPVNLIGDLRLHYHVFGREFRVTAGAFFRSNLSLIEPLVEAVLAGLALRGGERVLDLYAGVGVFSAFIASQANLVTLVEDDPTTADDADANLSDMDNVDVIEGAVEDVLPALDEKYGAAVIDPPSEGLSLPALDALADLAPPRLVYVSGDPASLARDGKRLAAKGYRLEYAQPLDLAPQTWGIDSVAVFTL